MQPASILMRGAKKIRRISLRWLRPIINEREYSITAQRRSGHHAIINWIRLNLDHQSIFLNNCYFGRNPYVTNNQATMMNPPDHQEIPYDTSDDIAGVFKKKHCLLYNYEDQDLDLILKQDVGSSRVRWLGKSRQYYGIYVIRDPFNLLASNLRWARGSKYQPHIQDLLTIKNRWKLYAAAFRENYTAPGTTIWINYNDWFSSEKTRQDYARLLNLADHTRGVDAIARYGPVNWGDSFDDLNYDGRAQEMKVFSRWKTYISDEEYLSLINDSELIELSERIYKHIEEIAEAIEFAKQSYSKGS